MSERPLSKALVGLTGMPGSGKSVVANVARRMGCAVVVMGDEVREEARRRGLRPSPEGLGELMLKLREEEGPASIARRCIPKIEGAERRVVIVDGIRSLSEVKEFKRRFPSFTLVAVHSSPDVRFKRLFNRRREDDPECWKAFEERDLRELKVGVGDVIALADYMIVNEGSLEELKAKARGILKEVMNRWMK